MNHRTFLTFCNAKLTGKNFPYKDAYFDTKMYFFDYSWKFFK